MLGHGLRSFGPDVLLFSADKAPNFVALHPANSNVANILVVVLGAPFAKLNEEFCHSVNGNVAASYPIPANK
jgi:hypothetical protein